MEISLALIRDELGFVTVTYLPDGSNPKFSSVEMYVADDAQLSGEKLLVCMLSEALAADRSGGVYFLCLRDRIADEFENEQTMRGITVAQGDFGLHELFNRVQRIFVKVAEWVMAMERSVSKRGGLQELLDLAEPIFGSFITVQDSTFKLVAYTKNIQPAGDVMRRLVNFGYHPPETMELFRRHRRVEEFKMSTDIIVSSDNVTSPYDVVKKTFHLGGSIFIIVVMECCGKPADNAVVELFGMLIDYIATYTDIDIAQTGGVGGVKALALDILNGNAGSKEEARIRSTYCDYPFEGDFRLFVVAFEDEDNVPIAHLIRLLTDLCKDVVIFSHKMNILMIVSVKDDITDTCNLAERILLQYDFVCGISNIFNSLWDIPAAFSQAVVASDVSSRLKVHSYCDARSPFRLFSDVLIHHIMYSGIRDAPEVLGNSFVTRSLSVIRDYDSQHHTETMKILRLYLENERSATVVASLMHMHRNTVLYHMERISDLLGISLDDPDVRLLLMMAFKADDFINFN